MSRKPGHIHKFKRHTYKSTGSSVYFCALPDCNFKIGTEFALGKMCICWRCGEPFLMTAYSIRAAQPHCANCHKRKAKVIERRAAPAVDSAIAESTLSNLQDRMNQIVGVNESEDEDL